ncbi:MAG: hypothetical protein ABI047_07720 [Jatrophihabitantaceae bacterium]
MSFLGPVTRLGEHLVRPHDIEVLTADSVGAVGATVRRLARVGFQVRAELRAAGDGLGGAGLEAVAAGAGAGATEAGLAGSEPSDVDTVVQLTRGQADALDLQVGSRVGLRPSQHASVLTTR